MLQIFRRGASTVKLNEVALTVSNSTWYRFVFQVSGSNLTATIFNTSGVQLATVTTIDATYASGYSGVYSFSGTAPVGNYIDNFRIYVQSEVTATQLQVLLPGETRSLGSISGKSGTPSTIYTGVGYPITVNAVDANWNVDVDATSTVAITSNNSYALLPVNASLSAGTGQFTVIESLAVANTVLTAADVSVSLTSSNSTAWTSQNSYPFLTESFVDQTRVENSSNISFTTNAGTKYSGNPIMSHGSAGTPDSVIVGYNTIWKVVDTYYAWYSCHDGTVYRICYATSSDGVTWTKPSLGLVSYGGNTNNNIIISGSGQGAYGNNVWYDPDDSDASKRYKMLYDDVDTMTPKLATSADGINWTISGSSPWSNSASHEPRGLLKVNNRWYAYAQHYIADDREIVLYTNDGDFLSGAWVLQGTVLSTSSPENQKYGFSAWYRNGVFYGINEDFHKTTDISELDLWVSRDGINWTEKGNLIPNGSSGTYDSGFMTKSNMFTDFGNTWRLYYGGSQRLHSGPVVTVDLGYSEWSKERVTNAQLTDTNIAGSLRTVVVPASEISSKNLTINHQATSGTIKVEVLDSSNNILSGFSVSDSNVISGNSTSTIVTWGDSPNFSLITQDSIKLKFYLTGDSKLYSYEFVADTTAPTGGSISINSGASYANSHNVTLTISADSGSGATDMKISEDSSFTGANYETYATSKAFTLSSGDGTKTIYIKFKDSISNESASVSDNIVLDTTAPSISSVSSGTPTSNGATITWTTNEDASSKVDYGLTNSYGSTTTETDTTARVQSHSISLSNLSSCTTYHYRVRSIDTALNETIDSDNTFTTTGCASSSSSSTSNSSSTSAPSCGDQAPGTKAPWLYGAIAQDSGSVLLYFTEADNPVNKYVLEYGTQSGNYPYGVQDMGVNSRGQMTFLVKSLSPNTTYYFRVRGGNGCATGTWSNEISAKTKGLVSFNQLDITQSQLEPQSVTETPSNASCQTYTVKSGDTLWAIAKNLLGDGNKYKEIVDQNKDTYSSLETSNNLRSGWELKINCGKQTTTNETQKTPETQTQGGYDVKVKVIDTNKKPVEGAKVTIHSKVQETVTNKDGIAEFKNVEAGDHKVLIAYNNYEGEQSVNLTGDVKEFDLNVTVQQKAISLSPLAYGIIGIMGVVIIGLIILLIKNKRKE